MSQPEEAPEAVTRPRRISPIWLIPLVAAAVAAYLAWTTLASRGPQITITFDTGDGLVAGQTKVQHKAVVLGTVDSVRLTNDMRKVEVTVRMESGTAPYLTDHAHFWVVRPRFSAGRVSGLETLVSGSYIDFDPGPPGGTSARDFAGLEEPPAVRSDEPGRTYTVRTDQVGSLGPGSPVFYRNIQVGEVLGHTEPAPGQPVSLHVFVRAPFDNYVHQGTHFWNASGLDVQVGAAGVRVQMESLRALLAGGIAFDTPQAAEKNPMAPAGAMFQLYADQQAAAAADGGREIPFVTYFTSAAAGLARGSPVNVYGIPVGSVTDVGLRIDPHTGQARVRVAFVVRPDRLFTTGQVPQGTPTQVARDLLQQGMTAELSTSNYLTGAQALTLHFPGASPSAQAQPQGAPVEGAPAAAPMHTNSRGDETFPRPRIWLAAANGPTVMPSVGPGAASPAPSESDGTPAVPGGAAREQGHSGQQPVVLPSQAGNLQSLTVSLSQIVAKLNQLPLAEIGQHLNHTLSTLDDTLASPEVKQTLHNFALASASARDLMQKADTQLTPVLARLPHMSAELQGTLSHANGLVGSLDTSYGRRSDIHAELQRLLVQTDQAVRAIRLLADLLARNPQALLTGRAAESTK